MISFLDFIFVREVQGHNIFLQNNWPNYFFHSGIVLGILLLLILTFWKKSSYTPSFPPIKILICSCYRITTVVEISQISRTFLILWSDIVIIDFFSPLFLLRLYWINSLGKEVVSKVCLYNKVWTTLIGKKKKLEMNLSDLKFVLKIYGRSSITQKPQVQLFWKHAGWIFNNIEF